MMSEFDPAASTFRGGPKSLAALMNSGTQVGRLWRPEEFAAILRHQLSAPMLVDLGGFDRAPAGRLKRLSDAEGLLLKSFSELFKHPAPPLELLELTKEFAKANMDHPESTIPGEIAAVLYYASIASALVRLGARITRLNDADLRRGLQWSRDQSWVDNDSRNLLAEALDVLAAEATKESGIP